MNTLVQNPRTGLFFGSFDPVHVGHLIIAEFLVANTWLDSVWFLPSPQNPLKVHEKKTEVLVRKEMLELALQQQPYFEVCDIELQLPMPSYTCTTLKVLREQYPRRNFALIIGMDNLAVFDQWKNYAEILENTQIIVYPRKGIERTAFDNHPSVHIPPAPILEISSTYIRKSIASGKAVRYMLTEGVYEYIKKYELYRR